MSEWTQSADKLPQDGQIVEATALYRYRHYKHNSQQAKQGLIGRWQEHNGYGWKNCDSDVISWRLASRTNDGDNS